MEQIDDRERERELFARMDSWSAEGNGFGIHEDMKFLRRRLEEARAELTEMTNAYDESAKLALTYHGELERARNHNVQLLRRRSRHSCILDPLPRYPRPRQ